MDGRPLSIISKGEGLRLARGELFAPFIVEEDSWFCCGIVDCDTCSSALCAAEVEVGVDVEAGASEAFGWVEKVRMRRAQGVTGQWRYALNNRSDEKAEVL